jgi:hypothetical protein
MNADASIAITRPREWYGRFRKLGFLVDGEVVARIGAGETIVLDLEPGQHRLQLEMDWCTSPEVKISTKAGCSYHFRSESPTVWQARKKMRDQPESFFQLLPSDEQAS